MEDNNNLFNENPSVSAPDNEPEPIEPQQPAEPQQPTEPQPSYEPQPSFEPQQPTEPQPSFEPQQPSAPYTPPYTPPQSYSYSYSQPAYTPSASAPSTPPKKKKSGLAIFCVLLAVLILAVGISVPVSLMIYKRGGQSGTSSSASDDVTANANAPQLELNKSPKSSAAASGKALTPAEIYKKISPSIVAVKLYSQKSQSAFTSGSANGSGTNDSVASEGTGIIMKEDTTHTYTYILTCAHVISTKNMTAVIETEDGTRYDAEIVGYDARTDVGVLRIKKMGFTAAEFGDSDSLAVGDPVYAIGNPGGSEFFGSFTDGIVSAIGRSITSSIGYDMICIQHNAAISPGNSGGPLVNEYGQVIGINSSKIAATEFEGISFAVPITQAQDVINKVVQYGYVPGRPRLGISYVPNDSSSISSVYAIAVQMKGLPSGSLVIAKIEAGSDLTNTDVQVGDMITAVNGKKMDKADVLLETIANSKVGDTLTLSIFRIQVQGGRYATSTFDVKVKLIEETNNQSDEEETTRALTYEDIFGF
ncbi:MAG: trypsin-like peptidase domain-containing protein [Clostridia bacterium]|nr:trypsin-like peptidase domain-containing protein [Clostridia bacterium]